MSNWVRSSALKTPKVPAAPKRKAPTKLTTTAKKINAATANDGESSWSSRYEPTEKGDLAVHKKKVEELEDWLKHKAVNKTSGKASILLVVGPTGCGKSVALRILAKEHGFLLREWEQPIYSEYSEGSGTRTYGVDQDITNESVLDRFNEFLFQASRYKSIFDEASQSLVLIEDIPNIFMKSLDDFHSTLRKFRSYGKSPLVVLLCESSASKEYKLFPPDLKGELGITTISFNPVAVSLISKALKRIIAGAAKDYGRNFSQPSDAQLDSIVQGCNGDLRLAVNLLEVSCLGSNKRMVSDFAKPSTSKKSKDSVPKADSLKDSSLYLFHSLGKILYAKREEKITQTLPQHLKKYEKPATQANPEEVFERTCVSYDLFVRMLHNNATNFYADVDTACDCAEWFSLADYYNSSWDNLSTMQPISVSLALRGLMFDLVKIKGKTHFGTFKKPSYDWKKTDARIEDIRSAFFEMSTSTELLVRDILPYSMIIKPSAMTHAQSDVMNECVLLRRRMPFKMMDHTICENEVIDEEGEEEREEGSSGGKRGVDGKEVVVDGGEEDDEEAVIEEIDSD